MRQQEAAEIGRKEAHQADGHAGSKIPLHHVRIDVGSCEKGQHNGADPGDVIDPIVKRQADRIAGDGADDDLEQSRRDRDVERCGRGDERQRHP